MTHKTEQHKNNQQQQQQVVKQGDKANMYKHKCF